MNGRPGVTVEPSHAAASPGSPIHHRLLALGLNCIRRAISDSVGPYIQWGIA